MGMHTCMHNWYVCMCGMYLSVAYMQLRMLLECVLKCNWLCDYPPIM